LEAYRRSEGEITRARISRYAPVRQARDVQEVVPILSNLVQRAVGCACAALLFSKTMTTRQHKSALLLRARDCRDHVVLIPPRMDGLRGVLEVELDALVLVRRAAGHDDTPL
jgi:hypothetical protein